MAKPVGLPKDSKKLFEFRSFGDQKNSLVMLSHWADSYYMAFRKTFGFGSQPLYKNGKEFCHIPNFDVIVPSLSLLHSFIEFKLKALIVLKGGKIEMYKTHDIAYLWKAAGNDYGCTSIMMILKHKEYNAHRLLIEELSTYIIQIRYGEGTLAFKHNNKHGWQNKKPLQELSETCETIYKVLCEAFTEASLVDLNSASPSSNKGQQ